MVEPIGTNETGLTGEALLASLNPKDKQMQREIAVLCNFEEFDKVEAIVGKYAHALKEMGLFKTNKVIHQGEAEGEDSGLMRINLASSEGINKHYFFSLEGRIYEANVKRFTKKNERKIVAETLLPLRGVNPFLVSQRSILALETIKQAYDKRGENIVAPKTSI